MTKGWAISLALLAAAHLAVAKTGEKTAPPKSVLHVDFRDAPEARPLAERARQIGDAVYPRIVNLFDVGGPQPPRQLDIVFREHLDLPQARGEGEVFGCACRRTVFLNAGLLNKRPADFEGVLVHEMTHVAQDYPHMACRHAWQYFGHYVGYKLSHPFRNYPSDAPTYWVEGLADYVCIKLGHTNSMNCPQCNEAYPHYQSGYSCAAAFLLYIDAAYGVEVVRQLNAALRRGVYADDYFAKATGKPLPALWTDFQKTKAFKPVAGDFNTLHEALKIADDPSPTELQKRVDAYCAKNAEVKRFFADFPMLAGRPPEKVQADLESFLFTLRQPWGPAAFASAEAAAVEVNQALGTNSPGSADDERDHLKTFLDRHADLKDYAAAHDWLQGNPPPDFRRAVKSFIFMRAMPGGDVTIAADEFVARLKNGDRLPGWRKFEHGTVSCKGANDGSPTSPLSRTFECRKNGDATMFHYTVARNSNGSPWQLQRAWRTNAKGRLLAEYPLPR